MRLSTARHHVVLRIVNGLLAGTHFFGMKRMLAAAIGVQLGAGTRLVGPLWIGPGASLITGKDCWLGRDLRVHGNARVTIGSSCDLAPEVAFVTGSHELGAATRRAGAGTSRDIVVGDGVWIGFDSAIMGGTRIGDGCVVGARSLVTRDCQRNGIYLGQPARWVSDLDDDQSPTSGACEGV